MIHLNEYIQEKLIIGNNLDSFHNEEVLVLNKTNAGSKAGSSVFGYCYDFPLYSLGLDNLYKNYPNCNKFIFSYSESYNGQSYPVSKTFENGNLGIAKADNSKINNWDIFCQNFRYSLIKSKNIILELNNYYKKLLKEQLKYIMFISDGKITYKYNFLYLFYSCKKDAIQLHLSNTDYNKLLKDGFFD